MKTQTLAKDTPQTRLAHILDSHQPHRLLVISQSPVPMVEKWCAEHDCELVTITDIDPQHMLEKQGRFDLAIVADQLEYMNHHAAEALLGRLRNLHTGSLAVLYQPDQAPEKLRWHLNDFVGMAMTRDRVFESNGRHLELYSYELATYNPVRTWNNPRFWANPENWGKYWW